MSTEKSIKQQSKKLLAGNWSSIISAVVFVCVILIAVDTLCTLTSFLLGVYNGSGEPVYTEESIKLSNYINIGGYVVLFFLSPFLNGLFKMFSNVSLYGKTEICDVFFYFKNAYKYFKTCLINLILFSIFAVFSKLTDMGYHCLESAVGKSFTNFTNFDIISFMLFCVILVVIALKIMFYLIFINYQLFTYAVFDNISIFKCIFGMYGFVFRHLGSAIKLVFSFSGWILLCFFVVPAFYVLPYLAVSMANSAKWLFAYDKDRGLLC